MKKPDEILIIYDNQGISADRYTVVFKPGFMLVSKPEYLAMLGLSDFPERPQGFSQWGECVLNNEALGIEIKWNDLSEPMQRHIIERMIDG
jgi:hypothetical protein